MLLANQLQKLSDKDDTFPLTTACKLSKGANLLPPKALNIEVSASVASYAHFCRQDSLSQRARRWWVIGIARDIVIASAMRKRYGAARSSRRMFASSADCVKKFWM